MLLGACGGDRVERGPVMVLVLDALHAAHLGAYGGVSDATPTLDAVASRGLRFQRAFSNANWTLPSTACLMTGRLQEEHRVVSRWHRVDAEHALMPELFQDEGYYTSCWTEMPYAGETYGFGRGYDEFHYYGEGIVSEIKEGGVALFDKLQRWLEAMRGEQWFSYVHLRRPHSPYDAPPEFVLRFDPDGPLSDGSQDARLRAADTFGHRSLPEAERARVEALYLANLAAVDAAIANLVAEVESQGGLLLVLSDHGEALGTEGVFGHGIHLADDNIDVPLIVVGPGIEPAETMEEVCTVDVFPTLCDWLGAERPADADFAGRSFLPLLSGAASLPPRGPMLTSGKHGLGDALQVAAIRDGVKAVVESDGNVRAFERTGRGDRALDGPPDPELVQLVRDAQESAAGLFESGRVDESLGEAELRALERLGYGSADGAPAAGEEE